METILARLNKILLSQERTVVVESWNFDDLDDQEFDEDCESEEEIDYAEVQLEIDRINRILDLARKIEVESKYIALKDALEYSLLFSTLNDAPFFTLNGVDVA